LSLKTSDAPKGPRAANAPFAKAPSSTPTGLDADAPLNLCGVCWKSFKRRGDLNRHRSSVHKQGPCYWCPIAGCPRSASAHGLLDPFTRKDKLAAHLRTGRHKNIAAQLDSNPSHGLTPELVDAAAAAHGVYPFVHSNNAIPALASNLSHNGLYDFALKAALCGVPGTALHQLARAAASQP
jgi:hypothetical protein